MTGILRAGGRRPCGTHVSSVHPLLGVTPSESQCCRFQLCQQKFFSFSVLEPSVYSATCRPNPGHIERGANRSFDLCLSWNCLRTF